jgi:hypothetical protein
MDVDDELSLFWSNNVKKLGRRVLVLKRHRRASSFLASSDHATPNNFKDDPLDPELPTSFDQDDQVGG